jgi:hypothetical protein
MRFKLNDTVRVTSNCARRNRRGVIVDIVERNEANQNDVCLEEYAVKFAEEDRSWFVADDLGKTFPKRMIPFFRSEVLERWKQLPPDRVVTLDGERDQLIALLCDYHSFSMRRGAAEVDEFFVAFHQRIERAVSRGCGGDL